MNKRQSKKRKNYTHLIIGRYVYIKPSEWNKVKNKGNITQGRFIFSKLKEKNMYKPLADSTLMNMTKKEIIEHLRCAEHNHKVCEEQIEQQYKNCMILLKEERAEVIEEVDKFMKNFPSLLSHLTVMEEWENFKEQLKENK